MSNLELYLGVQLIEVRHSVNPMDFPFPEKLSNLWERPTWEVLLYAAE